MENIAIFTISLTFHIPFSSSRFFVSNTFISNARLKLVKYQAKAKQHPKEELLLFENFSLHPPYESSQPYNLFFHALSYISIF